MTKRIKLGKQDAVLIEAEADAVCEACGAKDELRPYGKRLESGRRMRICFACGKKDMAETDRAWRELFE